MLFFHVFCLLGVHVFNPLLCLCAFLHTDTGPHAITCYGNTYINSNVYRFTFAQLSVCELDPSIWDAVPRYNSEINV